MQIQSCLLPALPSLQSQTTARQRKMKTSSKNQNQGLWKWKITGKTLANPGENDAWDAKKETYLPERPCRSESPELELKRVFI